MSLTAYIDNALYALFEKPAQSASIDDLITGADKARDWKDWPQAAKGYAAAIAAGGRGRGLKVQLGHALKEMGDFDGAERMYREFLAGHPVDPDIHLQLGHLFNRKGDCATALTFYERAQELDPESADIARHVVSAQNDSGRVDVVRRREAAMGYVSDRKWENARSLLQSLVMLDGEKELLGILANVTKEVGRLDEASALYDRYLSYAAEHDRLDLMADGHLQLGHLHKITGEYSVALRHFLKARKIERANGEIDSDDSELEREIVMCLREIYPCFVFRG
jgi:tetratricopeptide (TPR) repeat protein